MSSSPPMASRERHQPSFSNLSIGLFKTLLEGLDDLGQIRHRFQRMRQSRHVGCRTILRIYPALLFLTIALGQFTSDGPRARVCSKLYHLERFLKRSRIGVKCLQSSRLLSAPEELPPFDMETDLVAEFRRPRVAHLRPLGEPHACVCIVTVICR